MVRLAIRPTSQESRQAIPGRPGCPLSTVAIGMPMSDQQRAELESALKPETRVLDIRDAPEDTPIVVVPPCSAHAIEGLMTYFPRAKVLVVEGLHPGGRGPVLDAISAGAFGYAVGDDGPADLAQSIAWISDPAA